MKPYNIAGLLVGITGLAMLAIAAVLIASSKIETTCVVSAATDPASCESSTKRVRIGYGFLYGGVVVTIVGMVILFYGVWACPTATETAVAQMPARYYDATFSFGGLGSKLKGAASKVGGLVKRGASKVGSAVYQTAGKARTLATQGLERVGTGLDKVGRRIDTVGKKTLSPIHSLQPYKMTDGMEGMASAPAAPSALGAPPSLEVPPMM